MLPNPSAILSNTFKVLRKHELIPRLLKPSRGIFFQRKQAFLKYRKNAEAGTSSSEVHATDEDEDDLRIGLVFEKSVGPNDEAEIISLLEIFNWVKKPSLTDCIALAKSIATNLYYLHAVDWLHKGLRSENILLLWGSNSIFRFDHTYMMGFEFSRPAWPDDATEIPKNESKYEVYKHPRAQSGCVVRRRFRKEFDIYSLGAIMVEIMLWEPIDRILGIDLSSWNSMRSLLGVRQRLLDSELNERIKSSAADKVSAKAALQDAFYEKVILELETGYKEVK